MIFAFLTNRLRHISPRICKIISQASLNSIINETPDYLNSNGHKFCHCVSASLSHDSSCPANESEAEDKAGRVNFSERLDSREAVSMLQREEKLLSFFAQVVAECFPGLIWIFNLRAKRKYSWCWYEYIFFINLAFVLTNLGELSLTSVVIFKGEF